MASMKSIALNGRLVVTVIHQPRSSIFDLFDKLILISEGREVYSGPSADANTYFATQAFACPKFFNPADYFLDILSPDNRSVKLEEEAQDRIKLLSDKWLEQKQAKRDSPHKAAGDSASFKTDISSIKVSGTSFSVNRILSNVTVLFWRAWTEVRTYSTEGVFPFVCAICHLSSRYYLTCSLF